VALFMAGLLGLTLALAQTSPTLFMVGLVAGIVCLVVAASTLCVRGLSRARRAQVALDRSCVTMAGQPDRATQRQEPRHPKRAPRYKLFPRGATSGRHLDRLSRGSRARTGS
jgi:hypothetical protein